MRRALLIGAPVFGLRGSDNDAALMGACLTSMGFQVRCLPGSAATRAGILAGYAALTAESAPGDAVVVYFSGHGGLVTAEALGDASVGPEPLQFIVPSDMADSGVGDFRGILGVELSRLHAGLADKTPNVTVILDCCHATGMARDSFTKKALPDIWTHNLSDHWRGLVARGCHRHPHHGGHPSVVYVAATGRCYPAYERFSRNQSMNLSLLTEELCALLRRPGAAALTWRDLIGRIREQVWAVHRDQRPEINGPVDRLIFQCAGASRGRTHTFFYKDGCPALRAGRVHGVMGGDRFELYDPTASPHEPPRAEAVVTEVGAHDALVRIAPEDVVLPRGLHAVPRTLQGLRQGVWFTADMGMEDRSLVLQSPYVSAASCVAPVRPMARIGRLDGGYAVFDEAGLPVFPRVHDAGSLRRVLARLARARHLLDLCPADGREKAGHRVSWGAVVAGRCIEKPHAGAVLAEGDGVFLRVCNVAVEELFVHVFHVNQDWDLVSLTAGHPGGVPVYREETRILGYHEHTGRCLWRVVHSLRSAGTSRMDHLVVVLTHVPCDLQSYADTGPVRRGEGSESLYVKLEHLTGAHRGADSGGDAWDVVHIAFSH